MPLIKEPDNHTHVSPDGPRELWLHSSPRNTQIYDFMKESCHKHGLSFNTYQDLWRWSISEPAEFWEDVWHYTAVKAHKPYDRVSIEEMLPGCM